MNPTQQGQQLDPEIVNLAKAIRAVETQGSSDPYRAKGASGEHGAYQFTRETWDADAPRFGVNVPIDQATKEQQNEVAYKRIAEKKAQNPNWNVGNFASWWNSGSPDHYNDDHRGTNKYGVKYDTPAYSRSVAESYQSIKGEGGPTVAPVSPSTVGQEQYDKEATYGASFPAGPEDTPVQAGAKALGNVPSSTLNLGKTLFSAVTHPGRTLKGLFNTVKGLGEKTGREIIERTALGDIKAPNGQTLRENAAMLPPEEAEATFNAVIDAFKKRYGSLEAAQQTATNDPVGVGADIFTILQGGAGIAGKTAALDTALTTATKPVKVATTGLLSVPRKVVKETLGINTGVGGAPLSEGFAATREGGAASQAFKTALRGKTSPDELVNLARESLGEVVDKRRQTYQEMLKTLENDKTTYDISPIYKELDSQLDKFRITRKEGGGLDFSRSKFALDRTAQADITNLVEYIKEYGLKPGDRTALGIDNLKQVLGGYFSPNSDYRAFVQGMKSSTRNLLNKAPGYTEAMKNYSEMSDYIDDIQKSLSLGDKAMVETTFKKLTSALKNNDFRQQVLQALDEDTGGNLISSIAGQRLSSVAPRGLAQYLTTGVGGVIAATQGGLLPLLGIALTTSPRVVGEFVRALGLTARGANQLNAFLGKFGKPAVMGGSLLERAQGQ